MSGWLVTGAGGMLGRDLLGRLEDASEQVVELGHHDLDITDQPAVTAAVERYQPDVVVNCAAWTAVDDAESDETAAYRLNAEAPGHLARVCAASSVRLLHVSTDYVFGGDASTPYTEETPPDPRTAYGRTKLAGEKAVLDLHPKGACVVRTAWLYGAHGPNFVATMRRLESTRPTVDVVDDQRGQPTWTVDLADRLVALGRWEGAHGIYHATNSGEVTWYGLAREIFALLGADTDRVRPVTTESFPRPAPRPAYSVLASTRRAPPGAEPLRPWREALAEALPRL